MILWSFSDSTVIPTKRFQSCEFWSLFGAISMIFSKSVSSNVALGNPSGKSTRNDGCSSHLWRRNGPSHEPFSGPSGPSVSSVGSPPPDFGTSAPLSSHSALVMPRASRLVAGLQRPYQGNVQLWDGVEIWKYYPATKPDLSKGWFVFLENGKL